MAEEAAVPRLFLNSRMASCRSLAVRHFLRLRRRYVYLIYARPCSREDHSRFFAACGRRLISGKKSPSRFVPSSGSVGRLDHHYV